jgi:hypothetical protein
MEASHIEALARYLCEKDGNDPDRLVSRLVQLENARGLGRAYQFIPPEGATMPMWHAYFNLAGHAIDFLRDGTVTETTVPLAEPCAHEWYRDPCDRSHKCLKCGSTVSEHSLAVRGKAA